MIATGVDEVPISEENRIGANRILRCNVPIDDCCSKGSTPQCDGEAISSKQPRLLLAVKESMRRTSPWAYPYIAVKTSGSQLLTSRSDRQ